jgi:membrane-bound ClpP family serine protease
MPNWHDVFIEINTFAAQSAQAAAQLAAQQANAVHVVRHKYLDLLHKHTGRNIIAYYSGWLSKPNIDLAQITDEDKNGFMTTVHKLDRKLGLDLILHTPGGGVAATQSIMNYLHKMFETDIRAFVPQIAMSAGTVMACCCKEIWMGKQSNLGPTDPQLRGIPCHGVVEEFRRAVAAIRRNRAQIVIWQQIIGQYRPTFLGQCEKTLRWSKEFVAQELEKGMFAGLPDRKRRAQKVANDLSNYPRNKTHERHFDSDECLKMGLDIKSLESDETLQDLVLTVHHCYMHTLMNSPAFKMIENHKGVGISKNVPVQQGTVNQKQSVEQTI